MTEDVEFLFDRSLIAALQELITRSEKHLLLVSPYIDLDESIKDSLKEKLELPHFKLYVLFGKNDGSYYRSARKDSLPFLQEFPNVEIRYQERLHAKFYANDYHFLMTSLNLYDYSLHNNIEMGMLVQHASTGLIQKALDASAGRLQEGIENVVKHQVLGMKKETNPLKKIWDIFYSADLLYQSEAELEETGLLSGLLGKKRIKSVLVLHDSLPEKTTAIKKVKTLVPPPTGSLSIAKSDNLETKYFSASQLAKTYGVKTKDVVGFMEQQGLIFGEQILELGIKKGLIMKTYMGNSYIAYPEVVSFLLKVKRA